jgi:hypothetical protein
MYSKKLLVLSSVHARAGSVMLPALAMRKAAD